VRGTGGLRLANENCATNVPGLFAAGDAASRELISGGYSGGGSHNSAWAISSGTWAGHAAARHAARCGTTDGNVQRTVHARASGPAMPSEREFCQETVKTVQSEVIPLDKNYFRSGESLRRSLHNLDRSWSEMRDAFKTPPSDPLRARETAAMVATARWMYRSALTREESRGMHRRMDFPHRLPGNDGRRSVHSGGLDAPWAAFSDSRGPEELLL
jgi:succinate dehydrogenase/fumarate reductase flavoprotein subunit